MNVNHKYTSQITSLKYIFLFVCLLQNKQKRATSIILTLSMTSFIKLISAKGVEWNTFASGFSLIHLVENSYIYISNDEH